VSPEAVSAGRAAARLAKQVERAVADAGLSLPQYRVLANLSEGPSVASTLAERLIVSRPSVTAIADGLVERGFVERSSDPTDRRTVVHVLTDQGTTVLAWADKAIAERLAAIASNVGPADRRRAFGGLEAWHKALDATRAAVVKKRAKAG
jgi:long-chain acyl-CoA synthetase